MTIWIVTSWNENLALFKYLSKYDHTYFVYYDQKFWPHWNQSLEVVKERNDKWIKFLLEKWVDKIILSSIMELYFLQQGEYKDVIIPIFSKYLFDYCFKYSLVWKIGILWDYLDVKIGQDLINNFLKKYILTEQQNKTKLFDFPFKYWSKEVSMRKYFLTTLSYSNYMVNKVIKFDMRYFKDSNVDTLIPMSYSYFNFQKTIVKYFNFKKCRFHKFEKIWNIIEALLYEQQDQYQVKFFVNGHEDFMLREKRLMWMLQRGKEVVVEFEKLG